MNTNYIDELNESQCAAVTYNDGPSLVIAGAGSGKTRVLTYKIAYLLEQENGYNPWNILALTFTNKAAREMKERIARQVGMERARYLWMGTFHSIFSRILRAEAQYIGFTSQFTIYDTADSKSLLRSIIKEMGLDEKTYKPGVVQARISNAKNHLVTPTGYAANKEAYEGNMAAKMPAIRVGIFEPIVDRIALLICFQSMILDMAGNVGTQSLAVTIRVLMDEDISAMQKLGFVFKEMRIGFLNGLLLGSASFVVIGIFIHI